MPLETGTFINDLNTANPTSTDPKSQGDDHLRLVKTVLKNTLPGFTGIVLASGTEAQGATVNDYTVTLSPSPAAYTAWTGVQFKATHTNTAAVTLQIGALGTKSLLAVDGSALAAGDITTGEMVTAVYDGTSFYLTSGNDRASRDGDTYAGTHNFTGAVLIAPGKVDVTNGTAVNLALTGTPTAPTATFGTSSTQIATTQFAANLAFSSALPAQSGNAGRFVTTNGTSASWALPIADQTGRAGRLLATNGTTTSWGGLFSAYESRTANTILGIADCGKLIDITANTFTQTVTACATLTAGWYVGFRNSGTGVITIDPNASETIAGRTTILVYPGEEFIIQTDGTALYTVGRSNVVRLGSTAVTTAVASVDLETGFLDGEIKAVRIVGTNVTNSATATPWLRTKHSGAYRTTTYFYSPIYNDTSTLSNTSIASGSSIALTAVNMNVGRTLAFTADISGVKTAVNGGFLVEARCLYNPLSGTPGMGFVQATNTGGAAVEGVQFLWSSGNVAGNVTTATFDVWGFRA